MALSRIKSDRLLALHLQPRDIPRHRFTRHTFLRRAGRVPDFAMNKQARRPTPPNRVRHSAHCKFVSSCFAPPRGNAGPFDYRACAYPDTDFHRTHVAPSRAHSFPRRPVSMPVDISGRYFSSLLVRLFTRGVLVFDVPKAYYEGT